MSAHDFPWKIDSWNGWGGSACTQVSGFSISFFKTLCCPMLQAYGLQNENQELVENKSKQTNWNTNLMHKNTSSSIESKPPILA